MELLMMEDFKSNFQFDDKTSLYQNSAVDNLLQKINNPDIVPTFYYSGSMPVGERNAYLLTARDIIDLDYDELLELFWDNDYSKIKKSPYIWLGSRTNEDTVLIFNGLTGRIETCYYNDLCAVRPVIRIRDTSGQMT